VGRFCRITLQLCDTTGHQAGKRRSTKRHCLYTNCNLKKMDSEEKLTPHVTVNKSSEFRLRTLAPVLSGKSKMGGGKKGETKAHLTLAPPHTRRLIVTLRPNDMQNDGLSLHPRRSYRVSPETQHILIIYLLIQRLATRQQCIKTYSYTAPLVTTESQLQRPDQML